MPEETSTTSSSTSMEEKPSSSSAAADGSVDVMEEAKKLIGTGNRHLVMGDVVSAVNVFQEACGMLAQRYGDTADECGEALFLCGKSLLELARMENSVLGNALEGVPEEEEVEEKPDCSKVESADNLDEKTRDELRMQVYEAMAEKEPTEGAETKMESGEGKTDTEVEEGKNGAKVEEEEDGKAEVEEEDEGKTDAEMKEEEERKTDSEMKEEEERKTDSEMKEEEERKTDSEMKEEEEGKTDAEMKEEEERKTDAEMEEVPKSPEHEGSEPHVNGAEKSCGKRALNEAQKRPVVLVNGEQKSPSPVKEPVKEKVETSEQEGDKAEKVETSEQEGDEAEKVETSEQEGDKAEKVETSEQEGDKAEKVETSEQEGNDAEKVETSEQEGDKAEKVETSEQEGDEAEKVETSEQEGNEAEKVETSEQEGNDAEKVETSEQEGDKAEKVETSEQEGDEAEKVETSEQEGNKAEKVETSEQEGNEAEKVETSEQEGDKAEKVETSKAEKESKPETSEEKTGKDSAEGKDDDEDDDDDEDGDGNAEDKEEEEVGNLQLAWEMLEVAKVIYKRKESKEDQLMAAQAYLKLGEVSAESGNYPQALEDFQECLTLQLKHLPPHSRLLAESHYHVATTLCYMDQYSQAIQHYNSAIKVIENRLAMLQEVIDAAEGGAVAAEERSEMEELKLLLPDVREKVEDAKESQRTASAASQAIQQTLGGASTSSAFPSENGGSGSAFPTANQISVRPSGGASSSKSVSDISHLVRKKRKPEEEGLPVEDCDAKQAKQEQEATVNGSGDSSAASNRNGVQEERKEPAKPSTSVESSV